MRVEDWLKDQPGLFEEIYRITPSLTFINEFTPDTIQMYYEMKHSQRQVTSKFEDKTTTQLASIISVMYSKSWTKVINEFSQTYKLGTDVTRRFVDDTTSMVNRDLTTNGKSKMSPYNSTEDFVGSSSQEDLMTDSTDSVVGHTSDDETTTLDAVVRYRELFADTVLIDRVFEDINEILTLSVYGTASGVSYPVAYPVDYPSQGAPSTGGFGTPGPQGPEGPAGPRGVKGPVGPQGPMGPKGEDGVDGTVTFEELTIEQKESLRGTAGPSGPAGIEGPKGSQGIQGVQGLPGDRGETGPIGPEGPRGDIGPQGPQGEQGLKGDTGPIGPEGPRGETGPIGPEGPRGPKGEDGVDGIVTFEELTVEQKESLRGPAGPAGPAIEVVDNLETDDSTKALSAKQGMELFQSVSSGKSLIATAISDKGVLVNGGGSFQELADGVHAIAGTSVDSGIQLTATATLATKGGGTTDGKDVMDVSVFSKEGDYVIAIEMVRSTVYGVGGWETLYDGAGNMIASQRLAIFCKKTTKTGKVTFKGWQSKKDALAVVLFSVSGLSGVEFAPEYTVVGKSSDTVINVPNKKPGEALIWGMNIPMWLGDYEAPWETTPYDIAYVGPGYLEYGVRHTAFFDNGSGSSTGRQFIPSLSSTGAGLVAAVRLIPKNN